MFNLAIELGGVNTSIYRRNQGLVLKEPSLVCASSRGEQYEIMAVGEDAEKLQGKTNESTYIFSPIVCGEVKSVEYATEMLKHFLEKVEIKRFPKENAVFLVPVGITDENKRELERVAKFAGLGKIVFVPSILGSALSTGLLAQESKTILVAHLGGTLTDVSAINMGSILKGASIELGGRYLDIDIAQYVSKKYKVEISIASAKRLKEKVASLIEGDNRTGEVVGIDESSGKPKQVSISSEDVLPFLSSYVQNIITAIETTINICPPEVSGDLAQDGVFISGGLCEIPGIAKYLSKKLQLKVVVVPEGTNSSILAIGKLLSNKKQILQLSENF